MNLNETKNIILDEESLKQIFEDVKTFFSFFEKGFSDIDCAIQGKDFEKEDSAVEELFFVLDICLDKIFDLRLSHSELDLIKCISLFIANYSKLFDLSKNQIEAVNSATSLLFQYTKIDSYVEEIDSLLNRLSEKIDKVIPNEKYPFLVAEHFDSIFGEKR